MVRGATGGLEAADWATALQAVAAGMADVPGSEMLAIAGACSHLCLFCCFRGR